VEAAAGAEDQAQKNLDDLNDQIALKEIQVNAAKAAMDQAEKSGELAQEAVNNARKDLEEATIEAPFDGVIANVFAKEGDRVPPPTVSAQPIIYLIDPSSMELMVEVDEIDIPQVELGQDVIITLDSLPDKEFSGTVAVIYPVPKEVGGVVVYNVKIRFEAPDGSGIKVGMSASADIVLAKRENVLLVPSPAIREDSEGNAYVNVVVNDKVQERQVVTGINDGFNTEIISGLQEGETVLETRAQ
jgi:HlyD family secretion protein